MGVQVVFAAGAHGWENISNNKKVYFEAVSAMVQACRLMLNVVLVVQARTYEQFLRPAALL